MTRKTARGRDASSPPVFILTGPPQGGKTTHLRKILSFLVNRGYNLTGFITHGLMEEGIRTGFVLETIPTGECIHLCGTTPSPDTVRWRRFYFSNAGIEVGIRALSDNGPHRPDLTIVDEVGPFELQGGVWAPYLDKIVFVNPRPLLLVIRETLVDAVIERWRFSDPHILQIPLDASLAARMISEEIVEWKR